jgi:Protein of unknown function (DUF3071)
MRTARLVGLNPDGKSLIVATEDGEELAIAVDDRLRAALRGDRPRLGQLENEMKSSLSPRDIQTRIRAGETLEDVGQLAGIPLDRLERFAAPVLAEREHIAAVALSSSVRRRGEASGHRSLRITVTERLVSRGVDIDTVTWDSYRLDDGRWAVTADYQSRDGNRVASFTFDPRGRFSVAGNDEARWLLGEQSPARGPQLIRRSPTDITPAPEDTDPTIDLSDELALVRATREPTAPPTDEAEAPDEPTIPVPRLLRPVADLPPQLGGDGYAEDSPRVYPGLSDATAVPETGLAAGWEPAIVVNYPVEPSLQVDADAPVRLGEPTPEPPGTEPDRPAEVPRTDEPPAEISSPTVPGSIPETEPELPGTDISAPPDATADLVDQTAEAAEYETESIARAAASADRPPRRKRATVPSWDEIMFGGPKRSR